MRALIVDDDELVRTLMGTLRRDAGVDDTALTHGNMHDGKIQDKVFMFCEETNTLLFWDNA